MDKGEVANINNTKLIIDNNNDNKSKMTITTLIMIRTKM